MGSLENPQSVTIVLEPEAADVHCRNARLKHTKLLSKNCVQDTYETDYCVLNEIGEGEKYIVITDIKQEQVYYNLSFLFNFRI